MSAIPRHLPADRCHHPRFRALSAIAIEDRGWFMGFGRARQFI
jgi:hypothetical protein